MFRRARYLLTGTNIEKPISLWLLAPNPPKEHRNIKTEPGPDDLRENGFPLPRE